MWFVDQAQITVKAGDGGRGCSSFAQPPYIRFPYPDGGDGGDGGDVIVVADPNIATLLDFHFRHTFQAGRGRHGGSNQKTGKRGDDLVIRVPVGTVLHDLDAGIILRDLATAFDQVIVAKGGRGGLGNAARSRAMRVKSKASSREAGARVEGSREVTASDATPGSPGERRRVRLELKLIADIGIIGCPNAGKSSLLSRISTAHPKIGAYPFTTRYPVLGVVNVEGRGTCVACDIPGLIEGAHEGKGLGIQFLRHIERTKVLVHLVDLAALDGRDPAEAFHQINRELAAYSQELVHKPQLVVANKMDLREAKTHLAAFQQALQRPVWAISCATGAGIPALLQAVWDTLQGERLSK